MYTDECISVNVKTHMRDSNLRVRVRVRDSSNWNIDWVQVTGIILIAPVTLTIWLHSSTDDAISKNCLYKRVRPAGVHACTHRHRPPTLCCALLLSLYISCTTSNVLKEMDYFNKFSPHVHLYCLYYIFFLNFVKKAEEEVFNRGRNYL